MAGGGGLGGVGMRAGGLPGGGDSGTIVYFTEGRSFVVNKNDGCAGADWLPAGGTARVAAGAAWQIESDRAARRTAVFFV
jgi:hypothetical protein